MPTALLDRVVAEIDAAADEAVAFTAELVRIPTVNPPGDAYEDCARVIGDRLERCAFDVEYFAAEGRPEHTRAHPRINVVGTRRGRALHPVVHLNGHFDVVPAGDGWTREPFAGEVERRPDLRPRLLRHEGRDRGGAVRPRRHPTRRHRDERFGRDQRHGGRGERRLRRRRLARRTRTAERGADRLRHHPRAALRRSDLHRAPRRLLVRGADPRTHRARQHAVPRRRVRSNTWACCSIGSSASCGRDWRRGRRRCR